MTTSVVANVIPSVSAIVSFAAIGVSYAIYCEAVNEAAAGRIAILNVPAVDAWLHTVNVDNTVEVEDGTVYSVVAVVAAGFDCPSVLYTVGIR